MKSLLTPGASVALAALLAPHLPATGPQDPATGPQDDVAQPGTLPLDAIRAMLADPAAHEPFVPDAPLGLGSLQGLIPGDDPLTPAKVELGRQLFFDPRLSRDGTVACATCHDPAKGWADGRPVGRGIGGQTGGRSTPTIVNRILTGQQFWDGRASSLEEQALGPIANPIEMGFTPEEAARRLNDLPGYRLQFEAIFGEADGQGAVEAAQAGPATARRIARAIAAFERTVLSGENLNDIYERALPLFDLDLEEEDDPEFVALARSILDAEERHRMSESAERGRDLFFGAAKCSTCHVGRNLTDELFHNIGVGMEVDEPDLGRYVLSAREEDKGAFKTPTMRDVARTAPYMHDGSLCNLLDVVRHYNRGGIENPFLSSKITPLGLTEEQELDLVRFMEEALSGSVTAVEVPRLP